jgi:ABC-2 type transport system permease protein
MTTIPSAWPDAAPTRGGRLGLMARNAVAEVRGTLRAPEFTVGAIAIPVLLYAMFGLTNASTTLPAGTTIGSAMMVSLSAYGVIALAIFTFGEDVAKERGRGWTRTLAATGFPAWVHLLGKAIAAIGYTLLIVLAMGILAAGPGGVRLGVSQWLTFLLAMVAGVLAFSTLGFAIAYLARPRAATVIANLLFLPLGFASGFFVPLSQLPRAVTELAPYLPTYHFGQLAYRTVMPREDIEAFTGAAGSPAWVHLTWLVASTALLGSVALWAARREAVTRRG